MPGVAALTHCEFQAFPVRDDDHLLVVLRYIGRNPLRAGGGLAVVEPARVAGFEWGTGFYINPVPPELAAAFLRETTVDVTAGRK